MKLTQVPRIAGPPSKQSLDIHRLIVEHFPKNPFVDRLVKKAASLDVIFAPSTVEEQWLYHPDLRTIYVWLPDLGEASLSYIVMVLSHELGHVIDFDNNDEHYMMTRDLHWTEAPERVEEAAFVYGYIILQELSVPFTLDQYITMIEPPMAERVRQTLERDYLCHVTAGGEQERKSGRRVS